MHAHFISLGALVLVTGFVSADIKEDPFDLSFYQKGAAIGDSYAAGIGAGNSIGWACSRYDGSYSNLVAQQLGNPKLDFTFTACSGAVISDVRKQAKKLSKGQEFVIVSAGGNDAGLSSILNACVYSFLGGLWHPNCDKTLAKSLDFIRGSEFRVRVADLIGDIKPSLATNGKIYYVGYGKFFDTRDHSCDGVSWHMWYNWFEHEYLTQERRRAMNELADAMNNALKSVVSSAGEQVAFIDYDSYIDLVAGRYCQPGQNEASGKSANRDQLFFYEMKTVDSPWFDLSDDAQVWHTKLKTRDDHEEDLPEHGSLGSQFGDLIMSAVDNSKDSVGFLQEDNADSDLEHEVDSVKSQRQRRQEPVLYPSGHVPNDAGSAAATFTDLGTSSATVKWSNTSESSAQSSQRPASSTAHASLSAIQLSSNPTSPESVELDSSGYLRGKFATNSNRYSGEASATAGLLAFALNNPSSNVLMSGHSAVQTEPYGSLSESFRPMVPSSLASAGKSGPSNSVIATLASVSPNTRSNSRVLSLSLSYNRTLPSGTANNSQPLSTANAILSNATRIRTITNMTHLESIIDGTIPVNVGTKFFLPNGWSGNSTRNGTSQGTVLSNDTHVMMSSGKAMQKSVIRRLVVSDMTARVFHPSQYGHAVIANRVLFQMFADRAKTLGAKNVPPTISSGTGQSWLDPIGIACNEGSTDTWAARDSIESALLKFCEDPRMMRGKQGAMTSRVFNAQSLDYVNLSIAWDATANLGEHACKNWLGAVADSCDVPSRGGNVDNWKHGGLVQFRSAFANATLNVQPLSVRRQWDGGKRTSGQVCHAMDSNFYLDRPTLKNNIDDYCEALAVKNIGNPGETFARTYNEGSPNRVVLSTSWPAGPRNYEIFKDECVYYMGLINDGCSIPDKGKDINPMNWKHGGTMEDNNGIQYKIVPNFWRFSPPQKPKARCQAAYQFGGYYQVVVAGQGFSSGDWGQQTLLPSLHRCGATTGWQFKYFEKPDGEGYEWIAVSTLPMSIGYGCLGWAVEQAGGPEIWC